MKDEIGIIPLIAHDAVDDATCTSTKWSMQPILSEAYSGLEAKRAIEAALYHATNSITGLFHVQ